MLKSVAPLRVRSKDTNILSSSSQSSHFNMSSTVVSGVKENQVMAERTSQVLQQRLDDTIRLIVTFFLLLMSFLFVTMVVLLSNAGVGGSDYLSVIPTDFELRNSLCYFASIYDDTYEGTGTLRDAGIGLALRLGV